MKRLPIPLVLLSAIIIGIGLVGIAVMIGIIPLEGALTGFYTFVFGLVVISILAIIGAVFFGMFISHRIFSTREFTTFEEEMLKMKEDMEEMLKMKEDMEEMLKMKEDMEEIKDKLEKEKNSN